MAITKIHAIKSTLGKALAYIENPDKTDGQMLVSGYNCEPQTASIDFEMTAVLAHKTRNLKRKRFTNLAYHLIQSFSPEDAVTPEQAHELGKKLAFEYTGGKYEYVVATHIDKGHIHNHIMLNAVSFYDYKKLRTVPYRTARQIRDISDRLCMEAHLSVIDNPQTIGQLYPENAGKKKSVSNRTEIRKRLNFCLERATEYSQFLSMAKGLEITPTIRGKHMNFGLPASKLVDTTAFEAKAPYNKYFVEALETAVPYPTNLNGSAFQTMFQKECESLWAGAITPEEFETRVDEQAAEILNK